MANLYQHSNTEELARERKVEQHRRGTKEYFNLYKFCEMRFLLKIICGLGVIILCLPSTYGQTTCELCKRPSRKAMILAAVHKEDVGVHTRGKDTAKMVLIPGGKFQMGTDDPSFNDATPIHTVEITGFYMDAHEVTNAQFEKFVSETGYKTIAERPLDPKDFPGIPKEKLVASSAVFSPTNGPVSLNDPLVWWQLVAGADWRHPKGIGSSIVGHENEPVTQVCYLDAVAYATWAGKRLPTEAEWEYAARSGGNHRYYWGDSLRPNGKWVANIFQGAFPYKNAEEDGYEGVAPIESYPPNGWGLYDMDGNVWEWCSDYYRPDYYANSSSKNPQGPANSLDPDEPNVVKRVQRGGSFLCSDQYCIRYRAGSRGKGEESSASNNLGFRCVQDIK